MVESESRPLDGMMRHAPGLKHSEHVMTNKMDIKTLSRNTL